MKKIMVCLGIHCALFCHGIEWEYGNVDGGIEVIGVKSGKPSGALEIPESNGGKPVISIGAANSIIDRKHGFNECRNLTSVTFPNNVTRIGCMAFFGCTNLKSVTIPNSVTNIGNLAFRGVGFLYVDKGNPVYSSLNDMLCSKDGHTLIQGHDGDVTFLPA